MADSKNIWDELRKPFPPEVIGQLPKGGRTLDFVGHAAVTDRLNNVVGPDRWSWAPMGVDERGLPALDSEKNLWIELTINGVTKPGVGDGPNMKERIGDALRNAAMRFGVALDLWTKDELESTLEHPENKNDKPSTRAAAPRSDAPSEAQIKKIWALANLLNVPEEKTKARLKEITTKAQASEAIETMTAKLEQKGDK